MTEKATAQLILSMGPLMDSKFFRAVMQQLKPGFSPMQIRILFILRQRGKMTMTALADDMHMSKQQLTPLMDKLCKENFVRRENNLTDRRLVNVELTEAGISFINLHDNSVQEIFAARLRQLTASDLKKLHSAFGDIHEIISKIK